MQKGSYNERLLWSQFKNGDREAFATLYRLHSTSLIAYGLKLCPDRDLLKDKIQELFVELWNSRNNLAAIDSVKFYLFKALRYKVIRQEKTRHLQIRIARSAADLLGDGQEDSIETTIIDKEIHDAHKALLQTAIKRLSERQQEIIQLRFYQGFSNEQIAGLMNMNYQSVCNLLYRALCRLKEKINVSALTLLLFLFV